MGQIKAGDGKVFDTYEQFVLDHCAGVSDQEGTLLALRAFAGKTAAQEAAEQASLKQQLAAAQERATVAEAQRKALNERLQAVGKELAEAKQALVPLGVPPVPADAPLTGAASSSDPPAGAEAGPLPDASPSDPPVNAVPPGGHGDPAEPPPIA